MAGRRQLVGWLQHAALSCGCVAYGCSVCGVAAGTQTWRYMLLQAAAYDATIVAAVISQLEKRYVARWCLQGESFAGFRQLGEHRCKCMVLVVSLHRLPRHGCILCSCGCGRQWQLRDQHCFRRTARSVLSSCHCRQQSTGSCIHLSAALQGEA